MEESIDLSHSGKISSMRTGRGANPAMTRRSLEIYKQSLRYSSGGESQPEEMAEDIREEEQWWQGGYDAVKSANSLFESSREKASHALSRSLGNKNTAATRQSLDSILRGLNEKDGMTDDELGQEVGINFLYDLYASLIYLTI